MDPYFDEAAAEIRGFDLGDDAEVLARLEARRAGQGAPLRGADWVRLGLLYYRASDIHQALDCLQQAAALRHAVSFTRYLQAQVCLSAGAHEEAASLLDAAQEALGDGRGLPPAALLHARGSLAWATGQREQAIDFYRAGLELDDRSSGRWRALGDLLLELGRPSQARDAYLRALEIAPDHREIMYRLALAHAQAGDVDGASHWLGTLLQRNPDFRARAVREPGFSAMRDRGLQRWLSLPDLAWMDELAPWLGSLAADRVLVGAGVHWLSREESDALHQRLCAGYQLGLPDVMLSDAIRRHAADALQSRVPVAIGPAPRSRVGYCPPILLFVDRDHPDHLWLALGEAYPPFLWLDAGTTGSSLLDALSPYFPRPRRRRCELREQARGFLGYAKRFGVPGSDGRTLEPADTSQLQAHLARSPFLEPGWWGSAFSDDPWPDAIPDQPDLENKIRRRQAELAAQGEGAVWSVTYRTRHSRSFLSFELHQADVVVAEVRYAPAGHHPLVARMNETFGSDYPADMPVDAIAALIGFPFEAAEMFETRLDASAEPGEISGLLTVLSALRHSDLYMTRLYRRYMDHPAPAVRTTLCSIFAAYNLESLLEEMSVIEPDEGLRAEIEALLDRGIPCPSTEAWRPAEAAP